MSPSLAAFLPSNAYTPGTPSLPGPSVGEISLEWNTTANPLWNTAGTAWRRLDIAPGDRLIYHKAGSTPGGRLRVKLDDSNEVTSFEPGQVIEYPFRKVAVQLHALSMPFGSALLATGAGGYGANGAYDGVVSDPMPKPLSLLSSFAAGGATINNGALPGAAGNLVGFVVNGVKRLRVWVDGGAAMTVLTVVPWFCQFSRSDASPGGGLGANLLFENGPGTIVLPDSLTTGQRRRCFYLDVARMAVVDNPVQQLSGMFLEQSNVEARNAVFIVEAVE